MEFGVDKLNTDTALFSLQGNKINDFKNLSKLSPDNKMEDEKLKKAAQDFESVFIKQFLEIMDSTVQKGEFLHGGRSEDTFKSMLNDEIAKNISSNSQTSFGLAEQIYQQMKDIN